VLYDDFEDGTLDPAKWSTSKSDGADEPVEQDGVLTFSSSGPIPMAGESLCELGLLAPELVEVPDPVGIRGDVKLSTDTPETFIDFAITAEDSGGNSLLVAFELDEGTDASDTALFAVVEDQTTEEVLWSQQGPADPETWYQLAVSIQNDRVTFFRDGTYFAQSPTIAGLQPTGYTVEYGTENVGGGAMLDNVELLPEPGAAASLLSALAAVSLVAARKGRDLWRSR
jgi:hypothetical protein